MNQAGPDSIINYMRNNDIEVTAENYLDLAYPFGVPENFDPSELPPELRPAANAGGSLWGEYH